MTTDTKRGPMETYIGHYIMRGETLLVDPRNFIAFARQQDALLAEAVAENERLWAVLPNDIGTDRCLKCGSDNLWRYGDGNPLKCEDCGRYQTKAVLARIKEEQP